MLLFVYHPLYGEECRSILPQLNLSPLEARARIPLRAIPQAVNLALCLDACRLLSSHIIVSVQVSRHLALCLDLGNGCRPIAWLADLYQRLTDLVYAVADALSNQLHAQALDHIDEIHMVARLAMLKSFAFAEALAILHCVKIFANAIRAEQCVQDNAGANDELALDDVYLLCNFSVHGVNSFL